MNVTLLQKIMAEKEVSTTDLANALGIDRSTLYRIFERSGETMKVKHVNDCVKILGLTVEEANSIFFANIVADERQIEVEEKNKKDWKM